MTSVIDIAKKCNCDPSTIRKWIKLNNVKTSKIKAGNNKPVQSLDDSSVNQFIDYWEKITTIPDNMIKLSDVGKINNVDRKTVGAWAIKNEIEIETYRNSKHPPAQYMSIKNSCLFKESLQSRSCTLIKEILDNYNTDWRVVKRWAERANCDFIDVKSEKGGRNAKALSKKDATKLEKYLMEMKSDGFFYMIQPVPELNENRIKLGFTKNISRRLKEHRSVCPNARLFKKWKCNKDDEKKIISKIAQTEGNTQLYTEENNHRCATEVFDCSDYHDVLKALDEIFE